MNCRITSREPWIGSFVALLLALCGGCSAPAYETRVLESPETRGLKGYEKPYTVNGIRYDPLRRHQGYNEDGIASWYGPDFHGKPTSNGETYDMHAMTAAHKTLPMGVYVRVTNRQNGRQAVVRVNDRGPFVKGRIIDLSYAAAKDLGVSGPGTAPVTVEALGFRDTGGEGYREPERYDVGPFTIQVGAFVQQENAARLAARLKSRFGTTSLHSGEVGGTRYHRVRVGSYTALAEAEQAKTALLDEFAQCFVVAVD